MLELIDQGWSDNVLTDVQVCIKAQNPTTVSLASPNIKKWFQSLLQRVFMQKMDVHVVYSEKCYSMGTSHIRKVREHLPLWVPGVPHRSVSPLSHFRTRAWEL